MHISGALNLLNQIAKELNGYYSPEELQSFKRIIAEDLFCASLHQVLLNPSMPVTTEQYEKAGLLVTELKLQKPIQYVLGKAHFFGMEFRVTPSVLIPRPETEELVDWILHNSPTAGNILDIGTGSGCIAISLAKNISSAGVSAIDISVDALEVAKANAEANSVTVSFLQADALGLHQNNEFPSGFDVIVSNPPYVRDSEKQQMHSNVLDYEPHLALFVPDTNPLLFYSAIAKAAARLLAPNGIVYCEINEALGHETAQCFANEGLQNINIKKDIHGKDRMICATKPALDGE
ncbi:MAG: peptide chain release factor N(5)-glutamine methyltransferase [Bacteroidales bacterium]|nr:peptide chain release factor N(5)-glutamine methyltransferase [Bacteroidales bacterium]MBN2750413.1 peptide chain release factor N(5)-glutamine methyltransferase [Bacteroidales bacterium]